MCELNPIYLPPTLLSLKPVASQSGKNTIYLSGTIRLLGVFAPLSSAHNALSANYHEVKGVGENASPELARKSDLIALNSAVYL